jgi:hypothetical protein
LNQAPRSLKFLRHAIPVSKIPEQAIEKLRELPEHEQDIAAAELLGYLAGFSAPKERTAISNGRSAERGEVASGLNRQSEGANLARDLITAPIRADVTPASPLCLAAR